MAEEFFFQVKKRDGRLVPFSEEKVAEAIFKAAKAVGGRDKKVAQRLASEVTKALRQQFGKETPNIEQIQDAVEKVLIEFGHAKTAKAYILYRDKRARARERLKVRKREDKQKDTTDILLLVSGSAKDTYINWDKSKIVEALKNEAGLKGEMPYEIASNVERKILKSGITQISTSLIRALVDNELFELGETAKMEKQTSIGIPIHDLNQIMFSMSSENANTVSNNPEAINLGIAETILKQYALKEVFSKDIADAHLKGAIHLHDLGYICRTYCSNHSLEYLKKYGLELHNLSTTSSPAKHAQTLTGHLNTFLATMQSYYAGALGIGFVNIFYAPLLVGKTEKELKQEAQYLIYSCSQNAFSRGSQTLFIDLNIHLGVPSFLKDVPAIGPSGKYMWKHADGRIEKLDEVKRNTDHSVIQPSEGKILTYEDFEEETRRFCQALMEVWHEGDSRGQIFPFPKCFDKRTELFAEVDGELGIYSLEELQLSFKKKQEIKLPNYNFSSKQHEFVKVSGIQPRGKKEQGIRIKLQNNIKLTTTKDHKYYVLSAQGIVEKEAKDLKLNDVLIYVGLGLSSKKHYREINVFNALREIKINCQVRNLKTNPTKSGHARRQGWCFIDECSEDHLTETSYLTNVKQKTNPQTSLPTKMILNEKLAKLFGYFVSEGSLRYNSVSIATNKKANPAIHDDLISVLKTLNLSYHCTENNVVIYGILIRSLFKYLFKNYVNHASQKHIPSQIFDSPLSVKKAFLQGLFNGDGTIKNTTISYSTASKKLAFGVQVLLNSLGIYSTIYKEKVKKYLDRIHYNLAIKGKPNIEKLLALLQNDKFNRLPEKCEWKITDVSWYNQIPTSLLNVNEIVQIPNFKKNRMSVTRSAIRSLGEVYEKIIPVRVLEIAEAEVDAIALGVEDDQHSFITAHGVLTKNCDLHVNQDTFDDPKQFKLFEYACQIASENGSPYFVFDRDEVTLSMCFTADTKMLIRKNGELLYDTIENIYDSTKGLEEKDVEFWKYPEEKIELLDNNQGKATFTPVTGLLKQKYKGKAFEIILRDGSKISVSPNHEFFVLKEGELIRTKAEKLKENDFLPVLKNTGLDEKNEIEEIDVLDFAFKTKNKDIFVETGESLRLSPAKISRKYGVKKHTVNNWHRGRRARYPVWLLLAEGIRPKGKIVSKYGQASPFPQNIKLTKEFGRWLGLYAAEGSIRRSTINFDICKGNEEQTSFIKSFAENKFGLYGAVIDDKRYNSRRIQFSSRVLAWLVSLFVKGGYAKSKELSSLIFNTSEEFKKAFIEGFLDGDGYSRQGMTTIEVSFHIASEKLASDLRMLMKTLGINSTIRKQIQLNYRNKTERLDAFTVRLANADVNKLDWGLACEGEKQAFSPSLWKLLPAKEMGITWDRVEGTIRHNLVRAGGNHVSTLIQHYPEHELIKQVENGLHFLQITRINQLEYNGFVYDFEVANERHGLVLPNGLYGSNCCRLRHKVTDNYVVKHPESMRFCGFQNVSINLPHAAYKAGKGNVGKCIENVQAAMDLAMKAHLQKKEFIAMLMSKPGMPLWQVGMPAKDGRPYIDLEKATYIIGLVGLNECVQYLSGKELHESEEAYKLGLKIISGMYLKVKEFEKKHKLKVTLEESPAESTAFRFAKVDMKEFPEAKDYVRGDLEKKEVYYTNSCHFSPDAPIDIIERIEKQGKFNTLIESGAITHVFLGEQRPDPKAIMNLVKKTWDNTSSAQITISPEFTVCNDCHSITPGFKRFKKPAAFSSKPIIESVAESSQAKEVMAEGGGKV